MLDAFLFLPAALVALLMPELDDLRSDAPSAAAHPPVAVSEETPV
jgi:hypothetical protein